MTTDGAVKDDAVALSAGFVHNTGVDETGRSIILMLPAKMATCTASRESKVRAVWYVIHSVLLENETSQKKGIVFISSPRDAQLKSFDRIQMKMMMESLRGCLPVRLSAIHICRPPAFISIILPIVKLLMGPVLRERIRFHTGSPTKVTTSLESCGVTKSSIPEHLGGEFKIS
jgi:CRAL/TRIO domain